MGEVGHGLGSDIVFVVRWYRENHSVWLVTEGMLNLGFYSLSPASMSVIGGRGDGSTVFY